MAISPFALCIVAIVLLGALGLPIGHSMIAGSILYLLVSGLDLGTAAEQILNGLFNSYVLLAIPLFILAADLMNIGSLTDRLLQFCLVLVGRYRGGLGHVNVVANMIFAGMSGSAIADAVGIGRIIIGMMTKDGRYPVGYAGAITASAAIIGPIIPPSDPDGALRPHLGHLDRLPIPRRLRAGRPPRHRLHGDELVSGAPPRLPRRGENPATGGAARHAARLSCAHAARHPPVRHLRRRDDADGGRRGGGLLCAPRLYAALSCNQLEAALRRHPDERESDDLNRHAHRRRPCVQLRGDGREHPERARAAHEQLRARPRRVPPRREHHSARPR